jgi:hypothetical protein
MSSVNTTPIELAVRLQDEAAGTYTVYALKLDGTLCLGKRGFGFMINIPQQWLEFAPYVAARELQARGWSSDHPLVVYWWDRDGRELLRSTIGEAAAEAVPQMFEHDIAATHREWEARRLEVATQLVDVGRMLNAFLYNGEQRPSRGVDQTMKEAEAAFAGHDYDRAEHLAKVVARMIEREAPRFAANPQRWIETREELRT